MTFHISSFIASKYMFKINNKDIRRTSYDANRVFLLLILKVFNTFIFFIVNFEHVLADWVINHLVASVLHVLPLPSCNILMIIHRMQYREVQFHGLITLPRLNQVPVIRIITGSSFFLQMFMFKQQLIIAKFEQPESYIGNLAISGLVSI